MKTRLFICIVLAITTCCGCGNGNSAAISDALHKFPGINRGQMEQLLWAKDQYCIPSDMDPKEKLQLEKSTNGKCGIPLPTWLPEGFAVEEVNTNLGKGINSDNMELSLIYSRKMNNGKTQMFIIDAGFEFGDLPYRDPIVVTSSVGQINLFYEPVDDSITEDSTQWGKKTKDYAITDWFNADVAGFPKYEFVSAGDVFADDSLIDRGKFEMISQEEAKKILASMKKL